MIHKYPMTEKIKKKKIEECLQKWSDFQAKRHDHSRGDESWYLTMQDRESILNKILKYYNTQVEED